MFKIVQTMEKGRRELTIVPSAWETNGQLFWPKTKADKLVRVAASLPEETWFRMQCTLKRYHLLSYEMAEEELERMLDKDETEQEDPPVEATDRRRRPRVLLPTRSKYEDDFNSLARSCMISEKISQVLPVITTTENNIIPPANDIYQYSSSIIESQPLFENGTSAQNSIIYLTSTPTQENNDQLSVDNCSNQSLSQKLDMVLENQKTIMENQSVIVEKLNNVASNNDNQLAIVMQHLAKIEAMFDTFAANSTFNNRSAFGNAADIISQVEGSELIAPINSLEELIKLEDTLGDKKVMQDLVLKLSSICGRKGSGSGINNCYLLVDRMFSRKFMTLCSWAGGARDKKEKIPFKIYKNIIQVFFRVVQLSDSDFSFKDCEDFLKNVIRNSTRRSESNMIRSSSIKRRPKSLSYQVQGKRARHETGEDVKDSETNTGAEEIEENRKVAAENRNTTDEGMEASAITDTVEDCVTSV